MNITSFWNVCIYQPQAYTSCSPSLTCNDDNDIGHRKQQKLDYHIFTCKFPVPYITVSADHDIVMMS